MLFFFLEGFFYLLVPIALHAAFRLVALGVHAVLPVCSLVWLVASLFWVVVSLFRLAGHAAAAGAGEEEKKQEEEEEKEEKQ